MMAFDKTENKFSTQDIELVVQTKGSNTVLVFSLKYPISAALPEDHGVPVTFVSYDAEVMDILNHIIHLLLCRTLEYNQSLAVTAGHSPVPLVKTYTWSCD